MSTPEYKDDGHESVQRLRRMETRLMRLCVFLGFDPSNKDRVVLLSTAPLELEVSGLDVSLGDLLDACRKSGITGVATLKCKGQRIGTIQLGDVV